MAQRSKSPNRIASLLPPPVNFAAVTKTWRVKMSQTPLELFNGARVLALSIEDYRTIWLDAAGNPQELGASLIEAIEIVRK